MPTKRIPAESAPQQSLPKPRVAVVTPFLDKAYGTERTVIEWLSHMPDAFEIHVYSQRVEDLDAARFKWHRIPELPGPGLLNFVWWFAANHARRAWDRHVRGLHYDVVYSPGINCFDVDVISVQIVFAEFLRQAADDLRWSQVPVREWPRLLHRKLYYRLIVALDRRIYADPRTMLVLYAKKTARDLERFYGRRDRLPVLYLGLDHATFNPARRAALRDKARREVSLAPDDFAVLVVGNDLRKKGITVLLEALTQLRDLPVQLLAAGREDPAPFQAVARAASVDGRWIVVDPVFRLIPRGAQGQLLTREDLAVPAVLAAATQGVHNYLPEYTFDRTAHIRMSRIPVVGSWLGNALRRVLPSWEDSTALSLLLERESFAWLFFSIILVVSLGVLRVVMRWYGARYLGVQAVRMRTQFRQALRSFFDSRGYEPQH
jgi:glycosyltransferase involved in cell wall biosynthesis